MVWMILLEVCLASAQLQGAETFARSGGFWNAPAQPSHPTGIWPPASLADKDLRPAQLTQGQPGHALSAQQMQQMQHMQQMQQMPGYGLQHLQQQMQQQQWQQQLQQQQLQQQLHQQLQQQQHLQQLQQQQQQQQLLQQRHQQEQELVKQQQLQPNLPHQPSFRPESDSGAQQFVNGHPIPQNAQQPTTPLASASGGADKATSGGSWVTWVLSSLSLTFLLLLRSEGKRSSLGKTTLQEVRAEARAAVGPEPKEELRPIAEIAESPVAKKIAASREEEEEILEPQDVETNASDERLESEEPKVVEPVEAQVELVTKPEEAQPKSGPRRGRVWRGRQAAPPGALPEPEPREPEPRPAVQPQPATGPAPAAPQARRRLEMQEEDWSWGCGEAKVAHDGLVYFAGAPAPLKLEGARSGRAWRGGQRRSAETSVASKTSSDDEELQRLEQRLEEGKWIMGRAARSRAMGCHLRLPGGREAFLPVEHMVPRTEASTIAVRKAVDKQNGRLRVRELGSDRLSMLTPNDEALRGQEIQERRRKMEEAIDHLRENYNPNKILLGFVSSVQKNGVFVSVIDGQDALIPMKELPAKFLKESEGETRALLEVGQAVQFRIIRYNWQSDGFTASMLPLAERGRATSRPMAAREQEVERPPSLDRSKEAQLWTQKGYSVVSHDAAAELNEWLKSKMEDKKSKKGKTLAKATQNKFLVSIAKGMNTKAVGNIELEKNVSEKEIKQAAIELLQQQGHLKAGEQHKGVTITKNIINVKL